MFNTEARTDLGCSGQFLLVEVSSRKGIVRVQDGSVYEIRMTKFILLYTWGEELWPTHVLVLHLEDRCSG